MRRVKYKEVRNVQPNYYEYTGNYKSDPVLMQIFVYNDVSYQEFENATIAKIKGEIHHQAQKDEVVWVNVHGLHDVELIKSLGEELSVEPFVISDILNTSRRSRIEEVDGLLFFNVKSILQKDASNDLAVEQISFILKENMLISFQEKRSDFFTHIRERIRSGSGMVRKKKKDYLLYLLLDAIMENFYITLEYYESKIEALLIESKTDNDRGILVRIEKNRENLGFLKRSILPLRDALYNLKTTLEDGPNELIQNSNHTFFIRLHQKTLELLEQIEYDLNTLESASDIFFSTQNQRMNQIMKTLTIFSVIFMPLTFIVGVYGMNFDHMPELHTQDGYFVVLVSMLLIAIIMTVYFKRKKWF